MSASSPGDNSFQKSHLGFRSLPVLPGVSFGLSGFALQGVTATALLGRRPPVWVIVTAFGSFPGLQTFFFPGHSPCSSQWDLLKQIDFVTFPTKYSRRFSSSEGWSANPLLQLCAGPALLPSLIRAPRLSCPPACPCVLCSVQAKLLAAPGRGRPPHTAPRAWSPCPRRSGARSAACLRTEHFPCRAVGP